MRLPVPVVVLTLAGVLVADGAALLLHDSATPYSSRQALEQFRAETAATPGAAAQPSTAPGPSRTAAAGPGPSPAVASRPAARAAGAPARAAAPPPASAAPAEVTPGVYRYATSGHEEVDVLGGSRHDYPAESTITYRPAGCGTEDRWQPLQQRVSVNTLCRGPAGLEARASIQRREFFGQSEEQDLTCSPGIVLVPDHPRPGATSAGTCKSSDTVVDLTVQVVDVATTTVGGRQVPAVHVRVDGRLTGATRGTTHREEWFAGSGLLLRGTGTTDTDRDTSTGVVHYTETYDVRLDSLDPQR